MHSAAHFQSVIELLDVFEQTGHVADKLMTRYFRQRRYIGSKDKAQIAAHFYGVLRNRLALDYLLGKIELKITNTHRVAAHISLAEASVGSIFNGERYAPARLPDSSLQKLSHIVKHKLVLAPEHVRRNVPQWLFEKFENSLGEHFLNEIETFQDRAPIDLRVNTIKTDRAQALGDLKQDSIEGQETELSPWGVRLDGRYNLVGSAVFKSGCIEIQDEGSQLLALLSNAKPGQRVVDFCAGAGGKTLALSAMMRNKGQIWACDVHSKRLDKLKLRQRRAGAHNIRRYHLSSEHDKWVKHHANSADIVFLDCPCSGTGTWRRNPDARWRLTQNDLSELVALQQSILESAARLVKPGGQLVYATCSLLREENEDQVSQFLDSNSQFQAMTIEVPAALQAKLRSDTPSHEFKCLTSVMGTDGFYMAKMIKSRVPLVQ